MMRRTRPPECPLWLWADPVARVMLMAGRSVDDAGAAVERMAIQDEGRGPDLCDTPSGQVSGSDG